MQTSGSVTQFHPLPKGEGRGEGEGTVIYSSSFNPPQIVWQSLQAPLSKLQRNSKSQIEQAAIGACCLDIPWSLDLEIWSFFIRVIRAIRG